MRLTIMTLSATMALLLLAGVPAKAEDPSSAQIIKSLQGTTKFRSFDPGQAEKLLVTPLSERRRVPVLDFLRAKAHLLSNHDLRRRLTD